MAAAPMWKQVDAAVARGELGAAMVRGTTVAEQLPSDSEYAGKLAAIAQQAQAKHAALAAKATPEQFAGRILHRRLVTMFGGTAPIAPADTDQLERQTMLSWTLDVQNPCHELEKRMADEYRPNMHVSGKQVWLMAGVGF